MKHVTTFLILISFISALDAQYRVYASEHNEINQTIIQTRDGGLLIAAVQFCYTPEEWVIEGCPVGIRLIKTNPAGDTLWTNEIINDDIQGFLHLFQKPDGYTLITAHDATYMCDEWVIDPALGLLQVLMYQLSETGEVIGQASFPDNCNLQLLNALAVTDTSYAVLARYSEPFASDTVEGHLYVIDSRGNILSTRVFEDEPMYKADIMTDSLGHIWLFFLDHDSVPRLQQYDRSLQLIEEKINMDVDNQCLLAEEMRTAAVLSDSGVIFVICDNPFGKTDNLEMLTFDNAFQLLAQKRYTLPLVSDFAVNEDQELIVLSQVNNEEDSSDIRLTYFNAMADSILIRQYRIPGNQAPSAILPLDGEEFAIVGSHNCCNLSLADGPGKTFLYAGELSTSFKAIPVMTGDVIEVYPNPCENFFSIRLPHHVDYSMPVTIYSSTGMPVHSEHYANQPIATDQLREGMYFITCVMENGTTRYGAFIKQSQ